MLVISRRVLSRRRPDEWIDIETPQGTVSICVVRLGAENVRIGIEAPAEFTVLRRELSAVDAAAAE